LGIGDWAQSPIPNPQSPIPNPQSPVYLEINKKNTEKNILNIFNFMLKYSIIKIILYF
jgi:hypothetical protein